MCKRVPAHHGEAARKNRLRRICEQKPSGRVRVPDHIHKMWKEGGQSRDVLLRHLEKADFEKVAPLHVGRLVLKSP